MRHRPELALTHLRIAELLLDVGNGSRVSGYGDGPADAMNRAPTETGIEPHSVGRGLVPRRPEPGSSARAGETPGLPEAPTSPTADSLLPTASVRAEAMRHLDIAIAELRDMKMQPALERALRHKEVLKA